MATALAVLRPMREDEVVDAIRQAMCAKEPLAIQGGGSKAAIGAPVEARLLDLSGIAGVVEYDPAELVLTVRPGTPLVEVEALVAAEGQTLAFAPFDHAPILGCHLGRATIGGVVAAGVAGSQRLSAGGARDHLLGFRAVSGRGEAFVAGAKVVKNVTGYDLPKLAAGSWGRLFAMIELTLKVLPRPREYATRVVEGLGPREAVEAMAVAMGSQAEVAAAAHLPAADGLPARTALRVQGFGPSVTARGAMLDRLLGRFGAVHAIDHEAADALWTQLGTLSPLPRERPLWRVNVPPSGAPAVLATLEGADWLLDWAGGLAWIATEAAPSTVRDAAARAGGHAQLVRANVAMRAAFPAFHPQPAGIAALETRVRRAFDPQGIFETGRF